MDKYLFLIDVISNSKNSKDVLTFAKELKEEGNLLLSKMAMHGSFSLDINL